MWMVGESGISDYMSQCSLDAYALNKYKTIFY